MFVCDMNEDWYVQTKLAEAAEEAHWDSLEALAQEEQLTREYCCLVYGEPEEGDDDDRKQ